MTYSISNSRVFWDGGLGYAIVGAFPDAANPAPGWTQLSDAAAATYLNTVNADFAASTAAQLAEEAAFTGADANRKAAQQSAHAKLVALGLTSWEATQLSGYDPDDDGDGPGDGDGDGNN